MIPKFRAWDKIDKKMIDVGSIRFNGEKYSELAEIMGDNPFYEDIWISPKEKHNVLPMHEIELMQSTGLKDKNDVEIYEGDIVRVTNDEGRTDFSDGGIGTVCGLEDLGVWYIDGQVHNGLFDINHCYYTEVIGNVYENKELLEEQE